MADGGLLYKNQVMLLSQFFFIKNNKTELLVCTHKYDFDILFFDQMSDFVKAAQSNDDSKVFVIDLDKDELPDIVVIDEVHYQQTEALVRVLKKNIEIDPGCEIVMLQNNPDPALARRVFDSGFDDILRRTDCDLFTRQMINRIHKIRISKDLISCDRATGLLNKVGFQNKALETLRRAQKKSKPLAYGIIDIDKFKTINDTWSHYFGDIVIKRLSLVLSAQIGERDLLSRFGGEEFVVLFWDCDAALGWKKLDALRLTFGEVACMVTPNEQRHFSFSGGLAVFPGAKTENELFLQADAQLYQGALWSRPNYSSGSILQALPEV